MNSRNPGPAATVVPPCGSSLMEVSITTPFWQRTLTTCNMPNPGPPTSLDMNFNRHCKSNNVYIYIRIYTCVYIYMYIVGVSKNGWYTKNCQIWKKKLKTCFSPENFGLRPLHGLANRPPWGASGHCAWPDSCWHQPGNLNWETKELPVNSNTVSKSSFSFSRSGCFIVHWSLYVSRHIVAPAHGMLRILKVCPGDPSPSLSFDGAQYLFVIHNF